MRALHVRLTLAFVLLLAGLTIGLLVLLGRTSGRYSDEVLQRLNSGIALYVVQELSLLKGGKVNEVALHELAHRTMDEVDAFQTHHSLHHERHLATIRFEHPARIHLRNPR